MIAAARVDRSLQASGPADRTCWPGSRAALRMTARRAEQRWLSRNRHGSLVSTWLSKRRAFASLTSVASSSGRRHDHRSVLSALKTTQRPRINSCADQLHCRANAHLHRAVLITTSSRGWGTNRSRRSPSADAAASERVSSRSLAIRQIAGGSGYRIRRKSRLLGV